MRNFYRLVNIKDNRRIGLMRMDKSKANKLNKNLRRKQSVLRWRLWDAEPGVKTIAAKQFNQEV